MKIKEANEICVALGKNIKFKPIFIKQMVDESGRSMTLMHKEGMERIWHGSIGNANFQEELQIQVQNNDKGGYISTWTEQ